MSRMLSRAVLLFCIASFSLPAMWVSAQDDGIQVGGVTVLAPDADYAGLSRAEWDARSWQWTLSFSLDASPSFSNVGESCGFGQHGPMFFGPVDFTGEMESITCVVPAGMAIYISMGSAGCSTVEPPPYFGADEEGLTDCANEQVSVHSSLQAWINGEEVPDIMSTLVTTPMFPVSFPPGNFYEIDPVVGYSVASTYSFIIAPPDPGEYVITSGGEWEGEAWEATTTLIVTEPRVIMPEASPEATPAP